MNRMIGFCAIGVALALMIVGVESGGIVRHLTQTAPVWAAAGLAFAGSRYAKWAAIGPFVIWLLLMINIWLLLLGLPHLLSGHFTALEIILTIIIGVSAVAGIVASLRAERSPNSLRGLGTLVIFVTLQCAALWLSFQPQFSSDRNFSAWISGKA